MERLRGFDFSIKGGVTSFGPPVGEPILAQVIRSSKRKKEMRIWRILFNFDYL
jgi:hypothetical protein